jgi:hypothetical protein
MPTRRGFTRTRRWAAATRSPRPSKPPAWREVLSFGHHEAVAAEANKKRSEATLAQPRNDDGTMAAGVPTTSGGTGKRDSKAEHAAETSSAKAKAACTNRGAVERAAKLIREAPELAQKVAMGELKDHYRP